MSFTIKCDKCGHTDKFVERKHRGGNRIPIIITTESEPGDAPAWLVLTCSSCGHKVKDL